MNFEALARLLIADVFENLSNYTEIPLSVLLIHTTPFLKMNCACMKTFDVFFAEFCFVINEIN